MFSFIVRKLLILIGSSRTCAINKNETLHLFLRLFILSQIRNDE